MIVTLRTLAVDNAYMRALRAMIKVSTVTA